MKKLFLLLFLSIGVAFAQNPSAQGGLTAAGADCTTAGACVTITPPNDTGSASVDLSGTFSATVQFEAQTTSDATWRAISGTPLNSTTAVTSVTAAGTWRFSIGGIKAFRVRCSTWVSGTVVVAINSGRVSAGLGGGSGTVSFSSGGTTANVLPKGTGTANTLADSTLTDDATTLSTTDVVAVSGQSTGTKYGFTGNTTTGLGNPTTGVAAIYAAGFDVANFTGGNNAVILRSDGGFGWSSGTADPLSGADTNLSRCAAGVTCAGAGGAAGDFTGTLKSAVGMLASANGQSYACSWNSELLTLSTSGTTTDTTANLLPANSVIEAVLARVTTTITTATSWQLGDPTTAGRFTTANATMTSGTTDIGKVYMTTGIASATTGIYQTAAAKVRVTTVGTPGAGAIRISVLACVNTPPTS
jgi:hypothetical protein